MDFRARCIKDVKLRKDVLLRVIKVKFNIKPLNRYPQSRQNLAQKLMSFQPKGTLKSKLLLIIIVVPKKFDSEREIGSAIPNMALWRKSLPPSPLATKIPKFYMTRISIFCSKHTVVVLIDADVLQSG